MKVNPNTKFEDYPLNIPSAKRLQKKISSLVEELKQCGSALTAVPVIKKFNKLMEEVNNDMSIIYVRATLNTQDPIYKRAQEKCDEISPLISSYAQEFNKILAKARYRKDLENIFGKYLFRMIDDSLRTFDEKVIPELIKENKLVSQYDQVLGSAQIEFRGQTYNLPQIGKFTQDLDQQTRKEAAIALDKWLGEHEEELGNIYDQLVHLRTEIAKKLGFKSFTELGYLRLGRTDYTAKDVKNYRKQIAECVIPVANKLYKTQMKNLGIKNPQYYDYNLSFKSGNPTPAGDLKYLVNVAKEMYDDMSKESSDFFNHMLDCHLLDLDSRPGKAPGGYCTYFPLYKTPFIFANFNGTQGDVNVLTHEVGHGFQAYLSSGIKVPEYRSPTLEACEIHSMSMEFFAWPYMRGFFGKDDEKYRYCHLADAIEFLPYGITVDEFQHWVYENPNATHLERCAKWREIEKAYTPHKKYDGLPTLDHGAYWLRQSHIFSSAFYYIDYTLAQVCAFQFLAEMTKNREKAWKKYVKLCKCGGKYPFTELLAKNKLRNPFEDGNVEKAIKPLVKILKGFDTTKF